MGKVSALCLKATIGSEAPRIKQAGVAMEQAKNSQRAALALPNRRYEPIPICRSDHSDAWLTIWVLDAGWQELNPIVRLYNGNMVAKAFGALSATLVLVRFGKANLLWILNTSVLALVLWLSVGLICFS